MAIPARSSVQDSLPSRGVSLCTVTENIWDYSGSNAVELQSILDKMEIWSKFYKIYVSQKMEFEQESSVFRAETKFFESLVQKWKFDKMKIWMRFFYILSKNGIPFYHE